ncbi:hypothetical protein FE257_011483 [Aspergillus nanangensis]|uniref:Uncharacterized protein n=1 Tax=Aspergillus nanangensis TaxID=2582783 RepID=A0AAD4GRE4_ASPNN|nr:hypothetical protein FE257_011483 [Aspergillus nanangensis]
MSSRPTKSQTNASDLRAFTPTLHTTPYPAISPSQVTLPTPYTVCILGGRGAAGSALARAYALAGATRIMLGARTVPLLSAVRDEVLALNPTTKVTIHACDITSDASVAAFAAATKTAFDGHLDTVVVNAGFSGPIVVDVLGESAEDYVRAMDVNAVGTFRAVRALLPLLLETEGGAKSFVAVSSMGAAMVGGPMGHAHYCVSKAAQTRLVEMSELAAVVPQELQYLLVDDPDLCAAFCVWLTRDNGTKSREALNGRFLSSFASIWLPATAMYATNGSSCAEKCHGGSPTADSDIVCNDEQYTTTGKGKGMKGCIGCEARSTWTNQSDPEDNDIYWFLYNQKYTIDYCLWQNSSNTAAVPRCNRYCGPLNGVLGRTWGKDAGQYDYCDWGNGGLKTYAKDCAACLNSVAGSVVLGNFVSSLEANCEFKPNASLHQTANLTRSVLFASDTTPMASETSGTDASSSGLSGGAIAGIVVGAVAVCVLAALFAWFFLRRRRRRRAERNDHAAVQEQGPEKSDHNELDGPPPVQELHSETATFELPTANAVHEGGQQKVNSPVELVGS